MATAIGSMPHTDVERACELMLRNFPEMPVWPQLPRVAFQEGMYVQFTEGLPGIVVDAEAERLYFDTKLDHSEETARLYEDYLEGRLDAAAISPAYARGFHKLLELLSERSAAGLEAPPFIKGQVTGPISLGLGLTTEDKKPALYNDLLRDALLKTIAMKAKWQEKRFNETLPGVRSVVFFDEPYLMSYGSALVSLNRDDAIAYLEEVIVSVEGLTGVHCCGNTDWSLIAETSVDIIDFDAYDYVETVALYPREVKRFLKRGGVLGWGIVPSGLPEPDRVARETVESLQAKLEEGFGLLTAKGIDKELLLRRALITPNCGTGPMRVDLAERTLALTAQVSARLREKYDLVR